MLLCFTIEHDVRDQLLKSGLSGDLAETVQDTVIDRLETAYQEIIGYDGLSRPNQASLAGSDQQNLNAPSTPSCGSDS